MTTEKPSVLYGARLRVARNFNALTQADLAEKAGVTPAFVCQVEASRKQPASETIHAFAEVLGFGAPFFAQPLDDEYRDEECHFRRRKTTALYLRNQVLAHGTLFGEVVAYLDGVLDLPKPSVPAMGTRTREETERAAERVRLHWGLGLDTPITNMTRVLERAGVVVTRFTGITAKIDAFSRAGARDVVVLNPAKDSASRTRWDMAHELGHLVMHRGMETGTTEREDEAHQFAGAFLLPRAGFIPTYGHSPRIQWAQMFGLKQHWGVSVAAMVRRTYDLGLIGAIEYRRAYKLIHAKGWHKGEPNEPAEETPEILRLAFEELARLRRAPADVAAALHLPEPVLERLTGIPVDPVRNGPRLLMVQRHGGMVS